MHHIIKLFKAPAQSEGRLECDEILLDESGVIGDKFYGKKADRSVLITGEPAYALAREHGIDLRAGDLGENILVDFDPRLLDEGSVVVIGSVELEVTRRCPICEHLALYDPRLPRLVKDLRGVYLRVLRGGSVDRTMAVTIRTP